MFLSNDFTSWEMIHSKSKKDLLLMFWRGKIRKKYQKILKKSGKVMSFLSPYESVEATSFLTYSWNSVKVEN